MRWVPLQHVFQDGAGCDFPGGPVVKHMPSSAGDVTSIPCQGTKISRAAEQLSPGAALLSPHTATR